MYAPPWLAKRALEVDPVKGTVREIGQELLGKYASIAADDAGALFAVPVEGASVVQIDAELSLADHLEQGDTEFCDVSVIAGGETFRGHRIVLSRVPFFAAAFRSDFAERAAGTIEVPDVVPDVFR